MRNHSRVAAATVVALALLVPATAHAQLRDVTAGDVRIQPDGQTLTVTLNVTCDPGYDIFGAIGTLIGRQGNTLLEPPFRASHRRRRLHRLTSAVRAHWIQL